MEIGAQHIDESGLVVLDVTAADEATAHAVMAENGSFIHGPEAVQRVRATDRSAVSAGVRGRGATSPRSKRLFMSGRKVPYGLTLDQNSTVGPCRSSSLELLRPLRLGQDLLEVSGPVRAPPLLKCSTVFALLGLVRLRKLVTVFVPWLWQFGRNR
ncbi:hypothetical protein GA0115254_110716 [Streptomyces sp. Ncost-T10-10d]|nr:hypothetical protein GA0115254_110716 [Streptomyces sp. Ncost-T10-10d]